MAVKVIAKRGTVSQIESALASVQSEGEIAYATDTKDFYVSDGTQFNKIGKDQLSQFSEISVVNNVNTWYLSADNILDLNPPESNPTGITFKPDGTKMFTIGYGRNRVQSYDLSTAWDITSAGSATESEYLVQGGLSSTQEDFFIDSSGTRMYVLSRSSDSVGQFTLNTAWDISDITFVRDIHVNSTSDGGFVTGEPDPAGITFKPDGTIMYIVGYNQDKVQQIPLSTAWDISTHGTITSISLSPANASQGIQFSVNGKEMYILDYSLDGIAHFTLSTAWDVTTANLTAQSIAFIRANESTPTGLFYRDDLGKCFIVGRSSDFAREVVANDVFSFSEGITAPVVYAPQVTADRLTTGGGGGGSNNFYNPTYARSTFQADSTTYLGYATSSPLIRLGNNVQQNSRIQVGRFTYLGTETIDDPLRVPRFQFFPSVVGAKSKVQFGKFEEDTATLIGGSMDIESIADTFDHKGEITLGGELKVAGDKPLAYKDPNLYTQGTQIVLDNFTEASDTDLLNHTPDTGSGYTEVFVTSGANNSNDYAKISGGNGYVAPARNNSNDGFRFVNDTTISTANYEARAVIKRQHGGDDPFVLFVKYIDEDNYFAMAFGNSYVYCTPISVVNGVYSTHGYMYYHANTSTADNENIDVALRVVGNNVHLFYEGLYRGSREINITGAGKAGIGFGRMNNSQYTSYDLGQNCHVSKFEIYELPDSLFDGSNSVHYIENGKVGIGVTNPERILDVGNTMMVRHATNANRKLVIGWGSMYPLSDTDEFQFLNGGASNSGMRFYGRSHYLSASKGNLFSSTGLMIGKSLTDLPDANTHVTIGGADTDTILLKVRNYSNASIFSVLGSGNVGIGTTSPGSKLEVNGTIRTTSTLQFYNTGGSVYTVGGFDAEYYKFYTSGNERLRIASDGNVGIGTTSPYAKLHLSGTTGAESAIRQSRVGVRIWDSQIDSSGRLTWSHYASEGGTANQLFTLDDNGNVGIGTTSPYATLTVAGNITQTANSYLISTRKLTARDAAGLALYNDGGQGIDIKDNNDVIVTSGNVGIGTTSPTTALQVVGRTKTSELHASNGNAIYTNQGKVAIGTSSVDASAVLNVVGDVKVSGTIKGKMEQMFACSFSDDLGTTKHYLSFTSNAEQTNVHADQAAMVMPYNGRVKSIQMRLSNIDGDTTRTFGVETIATGINMYAASNNWTIEETEASELTADDDFYLVNYVFSNESHFESGDLLAISIQDTEDAYTASRQTYVNVIIEYDLNNGMGNDTATTRYTS